MRIYTKHQDFFYESLNPINPEDFELGNFKKTENEYLALTVGGYQSFYKSAEQGWLNYSVKAYSIFPDGNVWVTAEYPKGITGRNGQYARAFQNVHKFTPEEFKNILKDLNPNWFVLQPYR